MVNFSPAVASSTGVFAVMVSGATSRPLTETGTSARSRGLGISLHESGIGHANDASRHGRVTADVQKLNTQLALYKSMNGFFPTTDQGLQALVVQPDIDPRPTRWYQLYKNVPKDPWQNNYIYICPGIKNPNSYDLYSAGSSRKLGAGTEDWGD